MKGANLSLLSLALLITGCATDLEHKSAGVHGGQHLMVRTTAYTASEPGGACSACGQRLHFGGDTYSAAADWAWLPLGTRFKMAETGRTYVIEDYGSALVGKHTIDLFMPSRAEMRTWGARNVDIEILEWGSSAMSLKLLQPRQSAGYVRTMVAGIRRQVPERELFAANIHRAE